MDLIHNVALIMVLSHFAHIIIFKMLVNFGLQAHIKMFKMLVNLGLQAYAKVNHDSSNSTMVKLKSNMVDQSKPWFATMLWHNKKWNTLIMWHSTFIKGFVTLWCLSRVTLHLAFIKGYVTLWLLVITPDSIYSIDISNIYTFHEAVEY